MARHAGRCGVARRLAAVVMLLVTAAPAADAAPADESGKLKAARCETCHGARGISVTLLVPNLAGQKEAYLVVALQEYRDGRRSNAMMRAIAATLSDADMSQIAAYFSRLPPR